MSNSTISWALTGAHFTNPSPFDYRGLIHFNKVTQLTIGEILSGIINNLTTKLERQYQAHHSLNLTSKHQTIKIENNCKSVINSSTTANSSRVLRRRILVYPSGTGA